MKQKKIKLNTTYIHNKSQAKYYVQDLVKIKAGNEWLDCVYYSNEQGEKFARKIEEFRNNFSECVE